MFSLIVETKVALLKEQKLLLLDSGPVNGYWDTRHSAESGWPGTTWPRR